MAGEKLASPTVSRGEFGRSLAESGLLDSAELLPGSGSQGAADGLVAAAELVAAGKLTRYQADAVLSRRFGDLRIGNYEILDRLGAGGMGTVFKARHRRMKRVVALKVLSREVVGTEQFAHRFQREVETIARLSHPNIVMAFDADEDEAGPFLVMEFVNGRDLASEVTTGGPLPVADAVDRILQAARGLDYAHSRGIVHRDIKPGNLLRDADGVVKVADLGLARISGPGAGPGGQTSLTQAGSIFGTVDYMSPEQAVDSGTVDQRADIYSLGCTLHFLLTGHPPYQGGSIMAVMLKHRDAAMPNLRGTRPDIPPELNAIFRRMVAKRPEDRHQTMMEVIRDLEQIEATINPMDGPTPGRPQIAESSGVQGQTVALDSPQAGALRDTFAFDTSPAGVAGQSVSQVGRMAGLTLVVAEPSRTQAGIIRNYLKLLEIGNAHTTGSGREAIEVAKRVGADVVISSLHLMDMTGVQLASILRADAVCARVGFILATSETDSEMTADLPQDSRTVVMPKPFDLQKLKEHIAAVLA